MRCDAMRCDAMRCDAMRCDAMRCDAMRCDAMRAFTDRDGRRQGRTPAVRRHARLSHKRRDRVSQPQASHTSTRAQELGRQAGSSRLSLLRTGACPSGLGRAAASPTRRSRPRRLRACDSGTAWKGTGLDRKTGEAQQKDSSLHVLLTGRGSTRRAGRRAGSRPG
eukprot:SAG22_NODE_3013_length_2027_cov_2.443465_4_plen_165_part_01